MQCRIIFSGDLHVGTPHFLDGLADHHGPTKNKYLEVLAIKEEMSAASHESHATNAVVAYANNAEEKRIKNEKERKEQALKDKTKAKENNNDLVKMAKANLKMMEAMQAKMEANSE